MFNDPTERPIDGGVLLKTLVVPMTAYYTLQVPEVTPAPEAARVLVTLHGWGQNARRFIRDFLPLRDSPVYVVCPQGPHQFYLDPGAKRVGFNWLTVYDRQRAIDDVNRLIGHAVDEVTVQQGIAGAPVFLLGFSQGVSMASRYAVRHSRDVAGLISLCADLAPDVEALLPEAEPFRVLLCRGQEDPVFSDEKVNAATAAYKAAGFPAERFDYEGGHEITPDLVTKLRDWVLL